MAKHKTHGQTVEHETETEQTYEVDASTNGHSEEGAQQVATTEATKAEKAPKVKAIKTANEQKFLKILSEQPDETSDVPTMQGLFGDDLLAMALSSKLAQGKFIDAKGMVITLNDVGRTALANFTAPPAKEKKAKAQSTFDRTAAMEAKWGPRDPNIGPHPTRREWEEARLANAEASLNLALVGRRMHPYSPKAVAKVQKATERRDIIKAIVDSLPEGDGGAAEASESAE